MRHKVRAAAADAADTTGSAVCWSCWHQQSFKFVLLFGVSDRNVPKDDLSFVHSSPATQCFRSALTTWEEKTQSDCIDAMDRASHVVLFSMDMLFGNAGGA